MAPMMLAFLLIAAVSAADLEKSCNAGKAAACDELGTRFRDGFGVRRNEVRAAQLFRKACQGKDNDGCADEARAMALAEGQNGDPRKALPRLEQLCKAGRARACGHLGEIYLRGLGSPQDAGRAEDLLLKGCDKGWGRACTNLSYLSLKANQRERAEELALRACELEDPSGCAYAACSGNLAPVVTFRSLQDRHSQTAPEG